MLRYFTAGESHGPCLTTIIEGVPAGFDIDIEKVNHDLWRRQQGYGRGGRMLIEKDEVQVRSGLRWGKTLGSPVTFGIDNRDWKNWTKKMSPYAEDEGQAIPVKKPRPGHADLTGVLKYGHSDIRNILERASARETVSRVAVGSFCKQLVEPFSVKVRGYLRSLGGIEADIEGKTYDEIFELAENSPVRMADPEAEKKAIELIDRCKKDGDTLGGVFEVVATGVPPGLGSHVHWDRKLDGRLAQSLMSIQAMKGVEIGRGFDIARRRGSEVHDEIFFDPRHMISEAKPRMQPTDFYRGSNNAGGLEGGMTTGEPLIIRAVVKPIATMMNPLPSVDLTTGELDQAHYERSDITFVPTCGVIAEAMVLITLADAFMEKFGGDHISETLRNHGSYMATVGPRHGP